MSDHISTAVEFRAKYGDPGPVDVQRVLSPEDESRLNSAATEAFAAAEDHRTRAQSMEFRAGRGENRGMTAAEKRSAEALLRNASELDDLGQQFYAHADFSEKNRRSAGVNAIAAELGQTSEPRAAVASVPQQIVGAKVTERATAPTTNQWVRTDDGRPATVERGTRFGDHETVREHASRMASREAHVIGQHGSFGQMVRSMTTTSGSALVPTIWSSEIVDRARNYAAVLQAGAQIVPMPSKVYQIGRLTGDPTAAFRAEGGPITASDPTFDNVTLTATSMSALVVGSIEWFQDADNVDSVVSNAIGKAIGLQLDLTALYGSITAGAGSINLPTPPNPRGILGALNATAASSVLGAAANGTTQTTGSFWNEILDLAFTPEDFNEDPGSIIWNSKAARKYAKSYDTQGQPLRRPVDLDEMTFYTSNQIPSYTQGTMTNVATDVFCGDFSQLLIGQRLDLNIQTLTERYAENGQVAIVANWRGDVGVARPRAFSVYKALAGA